MPRAEQEKMLEVKVRVIPVIIRIGRIMMNTKIEEQLKQIPGKTLEISKHQSTEEHTIRNS